MSVRFACRAAQAWATLLVLVIAALPLASSKHGTLLQGTQPTGLGSPYWRGCVDPEVPVCSTD